MAARAWLTWGVGCLLLSARGVSARLTVVAGSPEDVARMTEGSEELTEQVAESAAQVRCEGALARAPRATSQLCTLPRGAAPLAARSRFAPAPQCATRC
jgi:hypothetical protein